MKTKSIELNKEQRDAAETLEGPLLIVAGPGTGKTQLLSSRAAGIMKRKKIPGENILILTYTNAAAKSVKERLAKIVGFEGYRVTAETFHDKETCYQRVAQSTKHCNKQYHIFIYGCGLCATGVPCESGIPKVLQKRK